MLLVLGLGIFVPAQEAEQTVPVDPVEVARRIFSDHQDAVVWISAVVKIQMTSGGAQLGPAQEFKIESIGTMISPDGLTVSSYSMMDPMGKMPNYSFSSDGEETRVRASSVFSDVKFRLSDGTEVPARMILKDPDLDLAYLLPQPVEDEPLPEFRHLDLSHSPEAALGDQLIVLGRLGRSLNRQPTVILSRISAVVNKPRKLYVDDRPMGGLGTPVFTVDGRVLGITVLRRAPETGTVNVMAYGNVSIVVIPAEDVVEIGMQALQKAGISDSGKPAKRGAAAPTIRE